jgi:hypothetical protein
MACVRATRTTESTGKARKRGNDGGTEDEQVRGVEGQLTARCHGFHRLNRVHTVLQQRYIVPQHALQHHDDDSVAGAYDHHHRSLETA